MKTTVITFTILLLIIGGFGFCFISYNLFKFAFQEEPTEVVGLVILLIIPLFFGVFGILSFISILNINKFELDGDKLIVKSIFNYKKRVIRADDIRDYSKIEKYNQYLKPTDLIIFTKNKKFKICSLTNTQYEIFKTTLLENKPLHVYKKKKDNFKLFFFFLWGVAPFLLGLFIIKVGINEFSTRNDEINYNQLQTIQVTITKLDIDKGENQIVRIKAEEYPKYSFFINNQNFTALNISGAEKYISIGDKIELDIMKEIYERKLGDKKELSFLEKRSSKVPIGIYGLRKNDTKYLNLENINEQHKKDYSYFFSFFFMLVSLFMMIFGVFMMYVVGFAKD